MARETLKKTPRDELRDKVANELENVIAKERREGQVSVLGRVKRDNEVEARFVAETGYWAKGDEHKPIRWITHFEHGPEGWKAAFPKHQYAFRVGFTNISSGHTTGIVVRVVPAIRVAPRRHDLHQEWEWLLCFALAEPITPPGGASGNSSVSVNFNPTTGELSYAKGKGAGQTDFQLAYVAAALVGLCPPEAAYAQHYGTGMPPLTFLDATKLLGAVVKTKPATRRHGKPEPVPAYFATDSSKIAQLLSEIKAAYAKVPHETAAPTTAPAPTAPPATRRQAVLPVNAPAEPTTSDRVRQVLDVLAAIQVANPRDEASVARARKDAVEATARAHEVDVETISDACTRRLGDISRAEFDTLTWNWIARDDRALQERMEANVVLGSAEADLAAIRSFFTDAPESGTQPPYSLEHLANESFMDQTTLARWIRAIERKGQAILYGPPGTGKTFLSERIAKHLVADDDGFTETVQFHPAYAYEDFIVGLRPVALPNGRVSYQSVPGRFLKFCQEASKREGSCVLIIDEINRANIARVFGELMYLLEYRDRTMALAGGGTLQIPSNVRIIGTMNTADRSIAVVDLALRRRFAFLEVAPNYDALKKYHGGTGYDATGLITTLRRINAEIGERHYAVGTSFFMSGDIARTIPEVWQLEIEPYLDEYFFDQPERAARYAWTNVKDTIAHE